MTITQIQAVNKAKVATWSELEDREPAYALVANVDLVVIRYDDQVSVLYGRCQHRGALMADASIIGHNIVCGVHNWDYRYDTGVSEYNNSEFLHKFEAWIDAEVDAVYVDENEVATWHIDNPQPYNRDQYLGLYADIHGTPDEPHNAYVRELAKNGLKNWGHHGKVSAMGVSMTELPRWDDINILTGQLARRPLLDDDLVETELIIGPNARKPLHLEIPLFVSDMSFGALSEEAKTALAKGAELAGTGICSGEGGMLPEEQAANSRYFYELASARFGWHLENVTKVQAFHFKAGQGAKTGTGGHLPGSKVMGKKYVARAQQEAETQRKLLLGLGGVGLLILLVLIMGLLRVYVLIPRQPVAIVEGTEISTADYRKRFLYEQYFIDRRLNLLQTQMVQLQNAFPDNPQFQRSLEEQTAQQIQQIQFRRSELPNLIFEAMVEEELVKQEAARREITLSEAEVTEAYNARAAAEAGGLTEPDANATMTARAIASEDATATAELFTPTPTLTPTETLTSTEGLTSSGELTGTEAEVPPTPVPPTPAPTPTLNILTADGLTQAIADWEQTFADVANMTPEDLRQIIRTELLRDKLIEDIGAEVDPVELQAHARHILVGTEEEALAVIDRLNEGESFEDLAQELSIDPGSAAEGGDLGWFRRDDMVSPFAGAAFTLEIGEISEPVESQSGWHVIEVLEREERELDEAALSRAQRSAYDAWLAGARAGEIEDLRTPDSVPPQFGG